MLDVLLRGPATVILVIVACLFPSWRDAQAASGAAYAYRLTYLGYLAGIPTVTAQIEIETTGSPATYTIKANVKPFGLLKSTGKFAMNATADSAPDDEGVLQQFLYHLSLPGEDQRVHIRKHSAKGLSFDAMPISPLRGRPIGPTVTDPINALWSAFDGTGRGCDGILAIFDGYRLYDVDLSAGPADSAVANPFSTNPVWRCDGAVTLKAGFPQQAVSAGLYPTAAAAWVSKVGEGLPSVPLRVKAESGFGPVEVVLTEVQRVR